MKGFTLVEVLVAMALVAVAGTAALELTNLAGLAVRDARVQTVVTFAAQSKLAELRAAGAWLPGGSTTARVGGYADFVSATGVPVPAGGAAVYERRWRVASAPLDPVNTVVVEVAASRVGRPNAREVRLVTLMTRVLR